MHRRVSAVLVALTTASVLAIAAVEPAQAQTFNLLYTFTGGNDGGTPYAGLTLDAAGNLYGTAWNNGPTGTGTVFQLAPSQSGWSFTVLYSFADYQYCGGNPTAGVVLDKNGNLYTAAEQFGKKGGGTLVKLDSSGKCTALHSFGNGSSDPRAPTATPILDAEGNLYGDTGINGVAWEWSPTKPHFDILRDFDVTRGPGNALFGNMFRDAAGNLYGAGGGGYNKFCAACGVVYQLSPNGPLTRLHSFRVFDGSDPSGGVTAVDAAGNVYGTTYAGGWDYTQSCDAGLGFNGCGVVYKIAPQKQFSVLHKFKPINGGGGDGWGPEAGVILDAAGNLYGVTAAGGAHDYGTVFKLTPNRNKWSETILYSFNGTSDGAYPTGPLVMDTSGNLYGTTCCGGSNSAGTIFEITP